MTILEKEQLANWKTQVESCVDEIKILKTDILKLQKEITGIEGSSKAIRTGFAAKMKKSPALLPYFQFRMTAASGARTNAFMKYGMYMPPAKNAKNARNAKTKLKTKPC